jgi:hypothetical protein
LSGIFAKCGQILHEVTVEKKVGNRKKHATDGDEMKMTQ